MRIRPMIRWFQNMYNQVFGFDLKASVLMQKRQTEVCRKIMLSFVPVVFLVAVMNLLTQCIQMGVAYLIFALALLYSGLYVRSISVLWLALLLSYSINLIAFVDGAIEHMGELGFMMLPFIYFVIFGQKKAWLALLGLIFILEMLIFMMPDGVAYNWKETQVIVLVFMILSILASYLNVLSLSYQLKLEEKEVKTARRLDDIIKASELESQAWQETINQLHDVVLILDARGAVVKANQLAMDMYPSLKYAYGMHWQGLLQGHLAKECEGTEMFPEHHQRVVEGMIRDVDQRWLSLSFAPLNIDAFSKWQGVLICRDITERYERKQKEAQQQLYFQTLEQMKAVMTSSLTSIKVLDGLMALFLETFQADRAWVVQLEPWHDGKYKLVCQETGDGFMHRFLTASSLNLAMPVANSEENSVWMPQTPLGDPETKSQIIVAIPNHMSSQYWVILDICQQTHVWQRYEIELLEEMAFRMVNVLNAWQLNVSLTWREDQYQQLVDNLPSAVLILQEDEVIFANNAAFRMTGLSKLQDFKAHRLSSFLPEAYQTIVEQCFEKAMDYKSSTVVYVQMHDIDGKKIDVVLHASTIFYEGKVSLQLVIKDQTLQKKHEKMLQDLSQKHALMAQKMIDRQEEERCLMAQHLHEDSGQLLTALSMNLSSVKMNLTDAELRVRITESEAMVQGVFKSIRHTLDTLDPTHIESLGFSSALHSCVDSWSARHHIAVNLFISDHIDVSPSIQTTTIFRLIQAGLYNIAAYAEADAVKIHVYEDPMDRAVIILEIIDQGRGFDVEQADKNGLGLLEMRTRAAYAGGTLSIQSEVGKGTQIYGRFLAGGGSTLG